MPKGDLTAEEKAAQQKLKASWDIWRSANKGRTMQTVADELDMNHSSLSAYLNGRNPINLVFLMKIATLMRIDPVDIYPELFSDIDLTILKKVVPVELRDLLENASQLETDQLKIITELSESLIQQRSR